MNRKEILTKISSALPDNFESLDDPKLLLHFLMVSVTDILEKDCGLEGDWILVNGNMTLFELLKETKNS